MTQKDKDLLLQDLCARLPYGVKCSFGVDDAIYEICGINPVCSGASEIQATHIKSGINGDFAINACKPYLFPMSSMTREQEIMICALQDMGPSYYHSIINHYNEWHLDYRGLIPKGLALDATSKNIY